MENIRILEILSYIDGYAMCAIEGKIVEKADDAYTMAIGRATMKYNVSPIYRSALIKAIATLAE